PSPPGFSPFR
uniref:Nephilakinin-3 n=1 Tax=Trichonephila clavipes TaxID=2585209 RepID=BRK3_TRICX|nr:RecName: Full=Nephilakinin-3; AltName: Full=Nephilakinin-III [Trichonephila clavipes]